MYPSTAEEPHRSNTWIRHSETPAAAKAWAPVARPEWPLTSALTPVATASALKVATTDFLSGKPPDAVGQSGAVSTGRRCCAAQLKERSDSRLAAATGHATSGHEHPCVRCLPIAAKSALLTGKSNVAHPQPGPGEKVSCRCVAVLISNSRHNHQHATKVPSLGTSGPPVDRGLSLKRSLSVAVPCKSSEPACLGGPMPRWQLRTPSLASISSVDMNS
eukprot:2278043-Heterocapsa_arctica.AAC.1